MIILCNDPHDDNSHEPNGRTLCHAFANKQLARMSLVCPKRFLAWDFRFLRDSAALSASKACISGTAQQNAVYCFHKFHLNPANSVSKKTICKHLLQGT